MFYRYTLKHPVSHCPYHEHAEVRQVSSHPKHSGLEVFLMASQIYEGNDFRGLLTDFGPVQASSMTIWFVHHLWPHREGQSFIHSIHTVSTYMYCVTLKSFISTF